jgi:uncharacterized protein YkwD
MRFEAAMNGTTKFSRRFALYGAGSAGLLHLAGCSTREGASSYAGRNPAVTTAPLQFDPQAGLGAINETRARHFLPPFNFDPRLQLAAQNHADYLARTGKFGHEFGGETLFPRRIAAVGFNGSAGENLGVGYGSIEAAIEGWLDSPKHREIFMRRRYDLGGIAYAFNTSGKNPRYTHYWVMIVGEEPPAGVQMGPLMRKA